MSRIVYVNGDYVPEEDAKISVFDRGFLFGDGVYEVTSVLDGKPRGCRALTQATGSPARWANWRWPRPSPMTSCSRSTAN